MNRSSLLTGALAALLSIPAFSSTPVYREIRDWVVACDNTARCEARALAEQYPRLALRLVREAGPEAAVELHVSADDLRFGPGELKVDGAPLKWRTVDGKSAQHDAALVLKGAVAVLGFVDAIRNGDLLTLDAGEEVYLASLKGITAALLLVDEVQGRLGTPTAFIRRGGRSPAEVPPAPPLPVQARPPAAAPPMSEEERIVLAAAVRTGQQALLEEEDCFVGEADAFDEAQPLDADEAIVLLECWRGAYQGSSLAFRLARTDPARAERIVLALPAFIPGRHREDVAHFTAGHYDPERGELSHTAKGRGLADCGESATWAFDGDGFQLTRFIYLGRCAGGDPGDWMTLWRSAPPADRE